MIHLFKKKNTDDKQIQEEDDISILNSRYNMKKEMEELIDKKNRYVRDRLVERLGIL